MEEKILFENDYQEGGHPAILKRLADTNMLQTVGYSCDRYCNQARELIKELCKAPKAAVHFFVGGTQTNTTFIASVLRPHQGVVCAESGHINVHESGAIENTGHKVISLASADGKINAQQVQECYDNHWNDVTHEHMSQPGMVYISFPTENGTLYSKEELTALSQTCYKLQLPLYIDGARMGYGLMSPQSDLSLSEIAQLSDAFYIGGTKVGALFGEALVISNPKFQTDFRYQLKQRGGLLAKGRFLGLQFLSLLEDNLYFDISKQAVDHALEIKEAFVKAGFPLLFDSYTNQQFPILPNSIKEQLAKRYLFAHWCSVDDSHTAVRFCTSWATSKQQVDTLIKDIENLNA
ncbi:aminotransferase class I/II-fold pyridoxal phosphate-dependent enzyme [Gammaproteobacteria bacterium]|nr:aminotransferase class I/II-fold pyridoxal phosphate-dependent enzyme [Gammaproteobacteria bacterium]